VASKNSAICPDFLSGQQPQQPPAEPINTSPVPQTNDEYQFYDNVLTVPNLPNLQHAQIAPLQDTQPIVNLPARRTHTLTRTASLSSSHTLSDEPPSARTRSHSRSQLSSFSPVKKPLIMPQVTFSPLSIPKGGEGLQDENEDKHHEHLTISILNNKEGWTIVRHKKKKKKQAKTDKSDE
jgi:hypothetical protein